MTNQATVPKAFQGMKRQVIKHSSAIQIGSTDGDLTLTQRRAYNVLLAHAYDDLLKKTSHRMPVGDLCKYLAFGSNNTKHLKDALRGLVGIKVEWNILGADRQQTWGVAALLAEVSIKDGFCYWEYSSTLRKLLYSPSIYARINLSLQNKFNSKHSLILYENVFHYFRKDDGCGETPWIEVAKMRKLFGIKPKEYKQFKAFNNAVIKRSVEEVNQVTDMLVSVEYRKKGRSVAAIKFHVTLKSETPVVVDTESVDKSALLKRLVNEFGIDEKQSQRLLDKYGTCHIAENLVIVDKDRKAGKVKSNLAGYTVSAIQNDFRKDRVNDSKQVPVYEGMRVIYKSTEYVVDSGLCIHLEDGKVMAEGAIVKNIQSGAMRVFELMLYPGIKLIIDGQSRTIVNKSGEPVIDDGALYLSRNELIEGIKSRKYIIFEYPEIEISETEELA